MKKITTQIAAHQFIFIAVAVFALATLLQSGTAYCQIDYNYHLNNKGFRIGAGGGVTTLTTHYDKKPLKGVLLGSLDYDFNPYLSVGLEAQRGELVGVDNADRYYYASSTDHFLAGNFNARVAVGQFVHFQSLNTFMDAVKRIYLGAGLGAIHTRIEFTYNQARANTIYDQPRLSTKSFYFPFNFGTNIDLHGVLGRDKISLNPNYQLSYVNSLYTDGFISNSRSNLKGFFSVVSLKLKYKF